MATLLSTRVINTAIAGTAAAVLLMYLLSYSETGSPPIIVEQPTQNKRPDYYLVNTQSTHFDQQGLLDIAIDSEFVEHNPDNNSADVKEPLFMLYRDGALSWTVSSQSGVIYKGGNQVDLQQRVVITSSDGATVLKTPQLIIFPNKKLAKTDKPVTLQNPNGFTRSIGLNADLQHKKIDLLNQVRGQYQGMLENDEN